MYASAVYAVRVPTPIPGFITKHEKIRIEQRRFGVIAQRLPVQVGELAAGLLDDTVRGRRVPLRGKANARIEIRRTLRNPAELQRTADRYEFMLTQSAQIYRQVFGLVRAAT